MKEGAGTAGEGDDGRGRGKEWKEREMDKQNTKGERINRMESER